MTTDTIGYNIPLECEEFLEVPDEESMGQHLGISSRLESANIYQSPAPNFANDWATRPPMTRAKGDNVDPDCVYLAGGVLLKHLENHEAAPFCRYTAITDLPDIREKKDIAPFVLENVCRNTSANMAALATILQSTGFASPCRMRTGNIQIHMRRPMFQLKGYVENAYALLGILPHRSDMAKYQADSNLLPVETTHCPDLQEIGDVVGRSVGRHA